MATQTGAAPFSVRLSKAHGKLVAEAARREARTMRAIVERAIEEKYGKGKAKK